MNRIVNIEASEREEETLPIGYSLY